MTSSSTTALDQFVDEQTRLTALPLDEHRDPPQIAEAADLVARLERQAEAAERGRWVSDFARVRRLIEALPALGKDGELLAAGISACQLRTPHEQPAGPPASQEE